MYPTQVPSVGGSCAPSLIDKYRHKNLRRLRTEPMDVHHHCASPSPSSLSSSSSRDDFSDLESARSCDNTTPTKKTRGALRSQSVMSSTGCAYLVAIALLVVASVQITGLPLISNMFVDVEPTFNVSSHVLSSSSWIPFRGTNAHDTAHVMDELQARHQLPSLNLLRYEDNVNFPLFPDYQRPHGLLREEMPQIDDHDGDQLVKQKLTVLVSKRGGWVSLEKIDLTKTSPLQSEISGSIVYNHMIPSIKQILDRSPAFFSRVILIRTPVPLQGRNGLIPQGTLITLDGHHTTQVLKECVSEQQKRGSSSLRGTQHRNAAAASRSSCGVDIEPVHQVTVLNGVHPMEIILNAGETGAGIGHTLHYTESV